MTMSDGWLEPCAPAIELDHVSARTDDRSLIQNLSLTIRQGEILLITGPNGVGKTTLLRTMNGLQTVSSGTVRIFGTVLSRRTGPALRRDIGYVPQVLETDRFCPATAGEIILMGRYGRIGLCRRPGGDDRARASAAARSLDIERLQDTPFARLSGGEKKRVLIARALAQEPRILLLDEAFAWLDRKAEGWTIDRLIEYRYRYRITLIVVTHTPEMFPAEGCHTLRLPQDFHTSPATGSVS